MVYVNSVCVFPSNVTLKKGEWYYDAYAEVLPKNANIRSVTWHSEDTSVASVNASSGYIYANSAGTARIYATAKDGSGESDYITVTVTSGAIRVSSVCLNKSNLSLEKGNSYTLTATVYPTNASNQSLGWSSSNPSVATVSGGKVVAKAKGGAWITATAQDGSGESDSCYVTVTGNTLVTSVMVEPASKTMTVGESTYLYEIVCPTNATNKSVEWSSNKTSVATVNPISGLVVAQGAGTAVITATAQDGSGKKGSCTVRVEPPVAVECIQVSPKTKTMKVGETAYLDAIVCPVNATDKRVTWCSSNQNVATVNMYTGEVEAKLAGTTVIMATSVDGGYTSCCTVTVNQILTGADLYITDQDIINTIINSKNLSDVAYDMYISGKISSCQLQEIQGSAQYAANLARADFIVVNDQSDFAYQYFKGRNYQNGDVSPFNRELLYRESKPMTGLDVMIVQRGMQAIGYFEPEETYRYGTYDLETFNAAANNNVLLGDRFDAAAYRVIFNTANSSQRTPQWLLDLQEYSRQHRTTQLAVAGRASANVEVTIKGGGPNGTFNGRADILRDRGGYSEIWEVKHSNPTNLQLGNKQLNRYITAARNNSQDFSVPLTRGYDFDTFYVPYSLTTCLEVSSTSVAGLIFYEEVKIPSPAPSFVPVPFPESQKEYEYQLNNIPINVPDLVDVVVIAMGIVCIGGLLYMAVSTGNSAPLEQAIRSIDKVIRVK